MKKFPIELKVPTGQEFISDLVNKTVTKTEQDAEVTHLLSRLERHDRFFTRQRIGNGILSGKLTVR